MLVLLVVWMGEWLTSLQTSMGPKTTCSPSKKLSPMIMTVVPPVVHPSLGQTALIVGVAEHRNPSNKHNNQTNQTLEIETQRKRKNKTSL